MKNLKKILILLSIMMITSCLPELPDVTQEKPEYREVNCPEVPKCSEYTNSLKEKPFITNKELKEVLTCTSKRDRALKLCLSLHKDAINKVTE